MGRVFVVGAYIPSGGTFMAYHMARVLHRDFGFQGVAVTVGDEVAGHGIFPYDPVFPAMGLAEMASAITDDDVLIANPSFSPLFLGMKCRGRKVMYVQDFKTFSLLDCRFDLYVAVSEVVRRFLSATWGIEAPVTPPFIRAEAFPSAPPWRQRPAGSILVRFKGEFDNQSFMLDRLAGMVRRRHPQAEFAQFSQRWMPQVQLVEHMGRHRHFLSLSVAEGFGLMPLEAMAMGATVLGFDALGGRDYMRPGINCATVGYPDLEGLAERIVAVLDDPDLACSLALAGKATAAGPLYTPERFAADWRAHFSQLLGA